VDVASNAHVLARLLYSEFARKPAKMKLGHYKHLCFMTCLKRWALKIVLSTVTTLTLVTFSGANANAEDPTGIWLTERGLAKVLIAKCAEELCGTIIALKDPIDPATGRPQTDTENEDPTKRSRSVLGIKVIMGMKTDGANKWAGQLYNAEDGKTYGGSLIMDGANALKVKGCIMLGVLCQTQIWTRTK
jgi:uncharacterized protein (DUF2147 family)